MQQTLWFIKSKRAQTSEDFETWVGGGQVIPTLNAFDVGDGREVVVIIEYPENVIGTITTAFGAKNYSNDQELRERSVVVYIDGTRVDDVRVYDEEIMQTVIQRWGTGGGNVPAIAYEENEEIPILGGQHPNAAIGVDVSPTLTSASGMGGGHTPIVARDIKAFDLYNQRVTEKNQTLSASASYASHQGAVWEGLVVRRLTPIECERLQGFPDNWTDGQADSSRYKQMGNAVAVPVVNWIIGRMVNN